MNENKVNPEVIWKSIKGKEVLNFTFKGILTHHEAQSAIAIWKEQFMLKTQKQVIVWNCLEMKGYEPMARAVWQNAIKELKGQIDKIWLVSDSAIIIAGGKIMSLFTSFEIKPVRSEDDIML